MGQNAQDGPEKTMYLTGHRIDRDLSSTFVGNERDPDVCCGNKVCGSELIGRLEELDDVNVLTSLLRPRA